MFQIQKLAVRSIITVKKTIFLTNLKKQNSPTPMYKEKLFSKLQKNTRNLWNRTREINGIYKLARRSPTGTTLSLFKFTRGGGLEAVGKTFKYLI